jgi:signal transduction histidine kinase
MVRALENLLENAIQHSKPEGTVTVRLARTKLGDREMLRCDVIDRGPGFSPEHMERLFTPFFTLRPGGTGLGLTIAKRIIEDVGGVIRLSNVAAGGAQVSVWLPLRENEGESRNSLSERESGEK